VITFTNLTEELYKKIENSWSDLKRFDNVIHFYSSNIKNDLSKIILKCSDAGLDVENIEIQKVNLETIFLSLTGKQLRD
jgi:hypothetical protein